MRDDVISWLFLTAGIKLRTEPNLTKDEAAELCTYHLRMATALYRVVDDTDLLPFAIARQCNDVEGQAALSWLHTMQDIYDRLTEKDIKEQREQAQNEDAATPAK